MARDENRHGAGRHEGNRGDNGTRRKSSNAADAVTTGAAAANARADAVTLLCMFL